VGFKDKTFLKLDDKKSSIKENAYYEVLLHQIITIVHFALEEEKIKKKPIKNYILLNERKVPEGKSKFLFALS